MTKQIIFIFALLCTLQAQASVQPVQKDTVRHTIHYEVAELLQPMQPVYLNGVLLPASRTGNWFVSISGGATVFLGTPLGCEDLFGRVKPSYSLAVGKWFTPLVGARVNYSGLQFKDAQLSTQDYPCRQGCVHKFRLYLPRPGRYYTGRRCVHRAGSAARY